MRNDPIGNFSETVSRACFDFLIFVYSTLDNT